MTGSGSVVVGVDGTDASRRAVRWAADEAGARGVVIPPTESTALDTIAAEFLDSAFGAQSCATDSLSCCLATYLTTRRLGRLVSDRDAFDLLINRVMAVRAGPRRAR